MTCFVTPTGELMTTAKNQRVIIREDGRVEQMCDHGIGHPVGHLRKWASWMDVHGCDGCCSLAAFALEGLGRRVVPEGHMEVI